MFELAPIPGISVERALRAFVSRAAALVFCSASWPCAATDVLVNNYDNFRTGANLSERVLNAANVSAGSFGRLFTYAVDGAVMAQPLIATDVDIPGAGRHDVTYITTTSNSVYAFDAHTDAAPLWKKSFTRLPDGSPAPVVGIYSTPVIDRASGTLYVVTGLMQDSNMRYVLHALDLVDGSERNAGPVTVAGAVSIGPTQIPFAPTSTRIGVQRAGLAIAHNKVIVAFGGDFFEGWVFAFDKDDLRAPPSAFCTTCVSLARAISGIDYLDSRCTFLGPGGGIWQAGRGPVVDPKGSVYFFTGNKAHIIKDGCTIAHNSGACAACAETDGCTCKGIGAPKVCRGPDTCVAHETADHVLFDVNEALIRLDPSAGLRLTGWFRPDNWDATGPDGLEINDLDLGASGPALVPGTTRLIGGGKQGVIYVLDTALDPASCVPSLTTTCLSSQKPNPVQSFHIAPVPPSPNSYYRHLYGGPVIWTRPAAQGASLAFLWRENDHLRSYALSDKVDGCDATRSATESHDCRAVAVSGEFIDQHPGGILALSANNSDPATAIVWASASRGMEGPGKLMAFKAVPDPSAPGELFKIWDSDSCEEDRLEAGSMFVPPTVANGKVYVATGVRVEVFGLIASRPCTPLSAPSLLGPMLQ